MSKTWKFDLAISFANPCPLINLVGLIHKGRICEMRGRMERGGLHNDDMDGCS